jgi:hypothetical protein
MDRTIDAPDVQRALKNLRAAAHDADMVGGEMEDALMPLAVSGDIAGALATYNRMRASIDRELDAVESALEALDDEIADELGRR